MSENNEDKKVRILYTMVFVRDLVNKKVLLGFKKRGRGENKWHGLGGKFQGTESALECAKRYFKSQFK
jgi:hypothetical protein